MRLGKGRAGGVVGLAQPRDEALGPRVVGFGEGDQLAQRVRVAEGLLGSGAQRGPPVVMDQDPAKVGQQADGRQRFGAALAWMV
jgi:hypothetical protein|nr:hypothetical protein [uncultured Thiocystis sp.]